jgi:phenylalanyl-tRNA synthetase beta chain
MRISMNWLRDYIDIEGISIEELATQLTDLGLEVEGIEHLSPISGEVVVGKVIEANPHPNADSLRTCKVDVGQGEPLGIVCGAPNARAEIYVAVAKVGSVLPGDFKIKSTKIRGEKSDGMLCSEKELGISDDHGSIIELQNPPALGASIAELFQLKDTVLTLGLTPNRADCLGYIGVARDLAARLNKELRLPTLGSKSASGSSSLKIQISNPDACPRFAAAEMNKVKVMPSPAWLQRRLTAAGMRPVNNLVDVTNYVMLESGQPIHAYDKRDVADQTLIARLANAGESIETLDGKTYPLQTSDIVIADSKRIVGLAGVMGGKNSEIREDTTEVLIEVANFDPIAVRKTSRRLGIHTEASHRFERGVDLQAVPSVLQRVCDLILRVSTEVDSSVQPQVVGPIIDQFPEKPGMAAVALRMDRLRQISGCSFQSSDQVKKHLQDLGLRCVDQKEGRMLFEIPSWRHDLTREIDLIEEVIRISGINKVPYALPVMDIGPAYENLFVDFLENTRISMARLGFSETISFPFIGETDLTRLKVSDASHWARQIVTLKNPIVGEQGFMQTTGLVDALRAISFNRRQGRKGCRIFEVARAYFSGSGRSALESCRFAAADALQGQHVTAKAKQEERAIERNILTAIMDQPFQEKTWRSDEEPATFFHAKESILGWLKGMGIAAVNLSFRRADGAVFPFLHPGASAEIWSGERRLGWVGALHPEVALAYELDANAAPIAFELQLDSVFEFRSQRPKIDTEARPFPPSTRDLALVVARSTTYETLEKAFQSFRRRNLKSYQLFDRYQGGNIAPDKQSLAFSLSFQSPKRTLNDKEVDAEIELLLKHLQETVGAALR